MRPCPNCGQDAPLSDRFCPHCGSLLPWASSAAAQTSAPAPGAQQTYAPPIQPQQTYAAPPQPQQAYAPPPQPQRQPASGATYTAQPPYADPNAYTPNAPATNTPAYVNNGVYGGNLPMSPVQQAPAPVAPIKGADPAMNTLLDLGRSLGSTDTRGLLRLAALLLAVVVAIVIVFKVVSVVFSLLPWLILIVAIIAVWQYRKRRRRP